MDKLFLSWEDVYKQSLKLAQMIKTEYLSYGEGFDYMVVVPRGGYFPANVISRHLDIGAPQLLHACVGAYNSGENNKKDQLSVGEMPDPAKTSGNCLLVIDEVCDTGETLEFIVDYLNKSNPAAVKTGVLHFKPDNSKNGFMPDWSVEKTNQWVVYPWELDEFNAPG